MGSDKKSVILEIATATDGKLRYAYTGTAGANAGPTTGARGNLRDSANYTSAFGHSLFNWCVHFERGVS